jgi:hypothetical protein
VVAHHLGRRAPARPACVERIARVSRQQLVFAWQRGILDTIVTGTAVLLALRIGLGW